MAVTVTVLSASCPMALDTEPLFQKIVTECHLFPSMPACARPAGGDPQSWHQPLRYAFDRAIHRAVDGPVEYACVMSVECGTQAELSRAREALLDCFKLEPTADTASAKCLTACHVELQTCGGKTGCRGFNTDDCGTCAPPTIDACFQRWDACKQWCDLSMGADDHPDDRPGIQ